MKRNFFAFAAAVLMLGMSACQKEDDTNIAGDPTTGNTLMVKSAQDLAGTEWTYTLSFSDIMGVELGDCAEITGLDIEFGLNFDNSYAHLVFPENVTGLNLVEDGDEYTMEEIQGLDYNYSYDAATQTGALRGANLVDIEIPFRYDEATDAIIVEFSVAFDDEGTSTVPVQLVFHRAVATE